MNNHEPHGTGSGESLKSRLREEVVKYLIASAYLFICFGVLQLYKAALLQGVGVHYLPLGVAAVKALIVGKFLLIGDAVRARLQRRHGRLLARIATRIVWLLAILALLTIVEELLLGWIHGHSILEIQSELRARSTLEQVAEVMLMGLILLPLVAAAELVQALGPGVLRGRLLRRANDDGQAVSSGVDGDGGRADGTAEP